MTLARDGEQIHIVEPDGSFDYRDAEKVLKLYFKERDMGVMECSEWARWTYGDMPFWSVWAIIYGGKNYYYALCGLHIYDDGRVVIVSTKSDKKI